MENIQESGDKNDINESDEDPKDSDDDDEGDGLLVDTTANWGTIVAPPLVAPTPPNQQLAPVHHTLPTL